MKRALLILILLCLFQIQLAELLHNLGRQLAILGNLPHRSLGMVYAATILQPNRKDYLRTYIAEWAIANADKRIEEGVRRPVIPFLAIEMSKFNPDDRDWRILAAFCSQIERDRKADLEPKLEVLEGFVEEAK